MRRLLVRPEGANSGCSTTGAHHNPTAKTMLTVGVPCLVVPETRNGSGPLSGSRTRAGRQTPTCTRPSGQGARRPRNVWPSATPVHGRPSRRSPPRPAGTRRPQRAMPIARQVRARKNTRFRQNRTGHPLALRALPSLRRSPNTLARPQRHAHTGADTGRSFHGGGHGTQFSPGRTRDAVFTGADTSKLDTDSINGVRAED